MQDAPPPCPRCSDPHVVRNGPGRAGERSFRCRGCGRRFVDVPRKGPVPAEDKAAVERMLAERLSLRAIARVTGRSRSWLQGFVNDLYRRLTPHAPRAAEKKAGDLTVEADELWSFVRGKARPRWVWAALDADTRQVVAMVVADRSEGTARRLWAALPPAYRDRAVVCTDFWTAYLAAVPEVRHAAAGKEAGLTAHVERFSCTLRQRCARFVRRTLSFSKCDRNHVGALRYFIRLYNRSRWCRP